MFPSMRQRLVIAATLALGVVAWLGAGQALRADGGAEGLSFVYHGAGLSAAVGATIGAALIVAVGSLIASSSGNPLAGLFVFSMSLTVLAGTGGSIVGWFRRATLPGGYGWLIVEMLFWALLLVALAIAVQRLRPWIRNRLPALAKPEHLGQATHFMQATPVALAAAMVCALVGGLLGFLLIRSANAGQVIGGLLVAFLAGGFTAQMIFKDNRNPLPIVLSPAAVAIGVYLYVLLSYDDGAQWLAAAYNLDGANSAIGRAPGLAMALPLHYASAAVAGATLGVGLAQTFEAARLAGTPSES